ncbi:TonB-dependent receptor domain-containing protein [Celeribacter indicus]|uniref:TonB-dependent receptor n=1 Tax=Celeribacter indicus TaxID=1208324 RepID=A0A0B5DY75_9RHOB|nr:TonB-dependent receptor [Celeribacter indicus]AJE48403.1 TonB-dependent receptor [Celeribacter indicus]SDX58489.1 outer membrane receptor for ferrienterochelin and colicins [Celeribacter indicus]
MSFIRPTPAPVLRGLLYTTALGLCPAVLSAQEMTEITLDPIVVTAAGIEQSVKEAPASITVVTGEELEKGSFTSLTDALREVQGVAVTGTAGEEDIFMRGLPGQYTLILVDGRRQSTRDARTNGSSGYEQSFIPPISAIERIEVVRGPMSSLYGSDAMGGVINIITKPVSSVWSGEVSAEMSVPTDDDVDGTKSQVSTYLSGPIVADRLGLSLWSRYLDRAEREDRDTTDGTDDGRDARTEREVGLRFTWTPTDTQEFELSYTDTKVETETDDFAAGSDFEHTRRALALTHTGDWSFGTSELSLSREIGERTSFAADGENPRSPEVTNTVLDLKFAQPGMFGGAHSLVYGGQYIETKLDDQNPGMGDGIDYTFKNEQWALFIEDEIAITDTFSLTAGLRYNKHSEYDGHWTPRLYGVWQATDALTVKGGYSEGFRAPDIRTTTPDYAYTSGGRNCANNDPSVITSRCAVILGDPDLKPEKTRNFELGAFYDAGIYNVSATVFHTRFDDKLTQLSSEDEWTDGPTYTSNFDGNDYYRRIIYNRNVDKAKISGLELTGQWFATDQLAIRGTYTYTDSEQLSGEYEGAPIDRTPEHMASLRLDYTDALPALDLWGAVTYHGEEKNAGLRIGDQGSPVDFGNGVTGYKYDAYTTVDIGANYDVSENASVGLAIYNVTDTVVDFDESRTSIDGRMVWLGLTTRF